MSNRLKQNSAIFLLGIAISFIFIYFNYRYYFYFYDIKLSDSTFLEQFFINNNRLDNYYTQTLDDVPFEKYKQILNDYTSYHSSPFQTMGKMFRKKGKLKVVEELNPFMEQMENDFIPPFNQLFEKNQLKEKYDYSFQFRNMTFSKIRIQFNLLHSHAVYLFHLKHPEKAVNETLKLFSWLRASLNQENNLHATLISKLIYITNVNKLLDTWKLMIDSGQLSPQYSALIMEKANKMANQRVKDTVTFISSSIISENIFESQLIRFSSKFEKFNQAFIDFIHFSSRYQIKIEMYYKYLEIFLKNPDNFTEQLKEINQIYSGNKYSAYRMVGLYKIIDQFKLYTESDEGYYKRLIKIINDK